MDPSIALDPVFADDLCTLYRWRSLIVLAWRGTPTATGMGPMTQVLRAIVRKSPGSFLMCALVSTDAPLPDSEARAALQAGIQRLGDLRGVVNVILGAGFRAASLRALLSGFSLVARPKYPVAFVGSEAEAATFIVARWPDEDAPVPSRTELARALASAAAGHDGGSPQTPGPAAPPQRKIA